MIENILNFAMLICATIGAMAFGILAAYWILRVGFAMIRPRPRHASSANFGPVKAKISFE